MRLRKIPKTKAACNKIRNDYLMTRSNIEITPSTKVNDLLEAYPELEEILISIALPFKKSKNPYLGKTVAKVATLKYISSVGKVPLNDLINKLRKAADQPVSNEFYKDENYFFDKPDWFSAGRISISIDEEKLEDKDTMTLITILKEAKNIKKGEIIELITTFLPAPGIDTMKSKGYSVWTVKEEDDIIKTYFLIKYRLTQITQILKKSPLYCKRIVRKVIHELTCSVLPKGLNQLYKPANLYLT